MGDAVECLEEEDLHVGDTTAELKHLRAIKLLRTI